MHPWWPSNVLRCLVCMKLPPPPPPHTHTPHIHPPHTHIKTPHTHPHPPTHPHTHTHTHTPFPRTHPPHAHPHPTTLPSHLPPNTHPNGSSHREQTGNEGSSGQGGALAAESCPADGAQGGGGGADWLKLLDDAGPTACGPVGPFQTHPSPIAFPEVSLHNPRRSADHVAGGVRSDPRWRVSTLDADCAVASPKVRWGRARESRSTIPTSYKTERLRDERTCTKMGMLALNWRMERVTRMPSAST